MSGSYASYPPYLPPPPPPPPPHYHAPARPPPHVGGRGGRKAAAAAAASAFAGAYSTPNLHGMVGADSTRGGGNGSGSGSGKGGVNVGGARALLAIAHPWALTNPQLTALVNALASRARPFALREWFCPTLDRAYFNEDAFGDALDAAGLGHLRHTGQRLTRTEWGAVRWALGRPRRLSPAFFRQERQRLEAYRSVVRGLQQGHLASPPPGALCVLCVLVGLGGA
jgi:hypothetical protein